MVPADGIICLNKIRLPLYMVLNNDGSSEHVIDVIRKSGPKNKSNL